MEVVLSHHGTSGCGIRQAGTLALLLLAVITVAAVIVPPGAFAKTVKIPESELPPPQPTAPESLAYYVDELPYRVAPGDYLDVDFGLSLGNEPIRVTNVLVRPDGRITLNPIGEVMVAGRTTSELDSTLTGSFANVYRNPKVTVSVAKLAGNFVHVFGQVRVPGSYEITPNATVLQAIVRAGGVTNEAAMGSVVLLRRTGPSSLVVRKVQLNRALSQGIAAQDPYVRRFDIVYVPKTTIANIDQFVDQFFNKMIPIPQLYIWGWEAFNIERVFPQSQLRVRPE
jgi:polysaccharide export outer membrane protein